MAERINLVIIDPQVDFCDPQTGKLYVPGAENDMKRVADLIRKVGSKIKKIHVTLDCHHFYDIAHPGFWLNSSGKNPDPFTVISHKDTVDGVWSPAFMKLPGHDDARKYVKEYTKKLEDSGRYPLCIWNPHCLIGSDGAKVLPVLFEALMHWQEITSNNINYVSKGSCVTTEHYSAIKAEVPDPNDASTQINTLFIENIMDADIIWTAGEAGSHCWKFTIEDLVSEFEDDSCIKKIVIFKDGISPVISPVADFPAIQAQFIADMEAKGMKTALTTDF